MEVVHLRRDLGAVDQLADLAKRQVVAHPQDQGRALVGGEPEGWIMALIALLSLIVNASVLKVLAPYRKGEVHLRAAWIFTRADVIANLGVIIAAMLVIATNSGIPDLLVGAAIGLYVLKEATEILREARDVRGAETGG